MKRLRRAVGRERGYSLVEMLIVLSILTTVMAGSRRCSFRAPTPSST